jgi:hypothetical protein
VTPQPDFTGVWIKIERAKHHFRDLQALVERFLEAKPYRAVHYDDPHTGDLVHRVEVSNQPPRWWSAIAGDCIHNLRSALDLLVCEVVRARGKRIKDNTGFTIAKSAEDFEARYPRKVEGVPKVAVDLIKKAKPYQGADNPFWRLHQLDIEDKHKLLVPVGMVHKRTITTFTLDRLFDTLPAGYAGNLEEVIGRTGEMVRLQKTFPLEDRAEIYRVRADLRNDPIAQMYMYPEFEFEVAFGEIEVVKGEPLIPTLDQLIQFVERFVELFPPLFSQEFS